MPELTIAATVVRALMDFAVSRGASLSPLAERARIDPAELRNGDDRIPFAKYVALMKAGQELCDDPALALHFGESDAGEISLACLVGAFSDTIAEGFAQMNRYARLAVEVDGVESGDRFQLIRRPGELWLVDTRRNPNAFRELTESTFARMVCTSRREMGQKFVRAVHVTHAAPAYRAEYDRIFGVSVSFESDRNALLIDDGWMSRKPPSSSRPIHRILTTHAEALLQQLESSRSTRGRVESLLIPILPTGDAGVGIIASELGLSRQTLFRKLKAEGVTFEKVLDDLRRRLALEYLSGKTVSISQAAYLVGFSEPAAFSRAFKRWTGTSPRMHMSLQHRGPDTFWRQGIVLRTGRTVLR